MSPIAPEIGRNTGLCRATTRKRPIEQSVFTSSLVSLATLMDSRSCCSAFSSFSRAACQLQEGLWLRLGWGCWLS